MKLEISYNTLELMLNSKTLVKIFSKIIEGYNRAKEIDEESEAIQISMEDLRQALGYKNKSTISRGLKKLSDMGLFDLTTSNQGTIIEFSGEKIRRVE